MGQYDKNYDPQIPQSTDPRLMSSLNNCNSSNALIKSNANTSFLYSATSPNLLNASVGLMKISEEEKERPEVLYEGMHSDDIQRTQSTGVLPGVTANGVIEGGLKMKGPNATAFSVNTSPIRSMPITHVNTNANSNNSLNNSSSATNLKLMNITNTNTNLRNNVTARNTYHRNSSEYDLFMREQIALIELDENV